MPRRFYFAAKMVMCAILAVAILGFAPTAAKAADAKTAFDKAMTEVTKTQASSAAEATAMEKAIAAARAVKPPPTVPDATIDHVGRAKAAARLAKGPVDFLDAANAFGQAARLAPWVAEYHYNRGVLLEKAEKHEVAERALGLYLKAAPNAQDRNEVRERIAGLGYAREKAGRERAAAATAAKPVAKPATKSLAIAGIWMGDDGISRYRVSVDGSNVEIVLVAYCPFGDCGQGWRSANRKRFIGQAVGRQLNGNMIAEHETNSMKGTLPCRYPAGAYAATGRLSDDERRVDLRAGLVPVNPACPTLYSILNLARRN